MYSPYRLSSPNPNPTFFSCTVQNVAVRWLGLAGNEILACENTHERIEHVSIGLSHAGVRGKIDLFLQLREYFLSD